MTPYEVLSLILEACVVVILLVEYFWGRPDIVMQHEEKQKRRIAKEILKGVNK